MTPATKARKRAALHTFIDRGMALVARMAAQRVLCSDARFMLLLERQARVQRIVRVRVDAALQATGRYEWDRRIGGDRRKSDRRAGGRPQGLAEGREAPQDASRPHEDE